jgi:Protein of unknown function (DUF2848).
VSEKTMRVVVARRGSTVEVELKVRHGLLAGYTGRDRATVEAHVAELSAHGIAAPTRVPTVYAVPGSRVCTSDAISVQGVQTSGEGEFVLFRHDDRLLVGVGSDHTDRALEEYSIVKAKQCSDKPVSPQWWDYEEISGHWDDLILRADVFVDGAWQPYQEGVVGSMMTPEAIFEELEQRVGSIEDDVVFSGTLPVIGGEFRPSQAFRVALHDPVMKRTLECEYATEVLPELDR